MTNFCHARRTEILRFASRTRGGTKQALFSKKKMQKCEYVTMLDRHFCTLGTRGFFSRAANGNTSLRFSGTSGEAARKTFFERFTIERKEKTSGYRFLNHNGILYVVWPPGVSDRESADQFIKARESHPPKEVKWKNTKSSRSEDRSTSTHSFKVRIKMVFKRDITTCKFSVMPYTIFSKFTHN